MTHIWDNYLIDPNLVYYGTDIWMNAPNENKNDYLNVILS